MAPIQVLVLKISGMRVKGWQQMVIPLAELAGEDTISGGSMNVRMILQGPLRREGLLAVRAAEHLSSVVVIVGVTCNNRKMPYFSTGIQKRKQHGMNIEKNQHQS
jgi:hypothetical protein